MEKTEQTNLGKHSKLQQKIEKGNCNNCNWWQIAVLCGIVGERNVPKIKPLAGRWHHRPGNTTLLTCLFCGAK